MTTETPQDARKEQAKKIWRMLKRKQLAMAISLTDEQPIVDCIADILRRTAHEVTR